MKKALCVFLFLAGITANERATAAPVTSYPSIASFESSLGPWQDDGGQITWNTTYSYSYWNGIDSWVDTYANEGFYFAYLNTSSGNYNQSGLLAAYFDLSSVTDPSITFDFHLSGSTGNSLYLYASTDDGNSFVDLWGVGGNVGTDWITTNISLSAYAGESNLKLFFLGHVAYSYRSDICLDHITVEGITGNDIDGDGMPNDWETQYFGGMTNGVPTGNSDLDQYNNLEEYIAGLNPTVSDGLWLTGFTVNGNNVFNWTPKSGRVYSVYWTDNLMNGFSLIGGDLTSGSFTDTVHGAESGGYYKLQVDVAP